MGEAAAQLSADPMLARSMIEPLYRELMLSTGESALAHADGVASILRGVRDDPELIAAAYLFCVPRVIQNSGEWIEKSFGATVAGLVAELGKLNDLSTKTRSESKEANATMQPEALRRMFLAMCQDLRVVLLKLASRLQTLRWFASSHSEGAEQFGSETLAVYAPLANRLGIWQIKWELEDLSLRFTRPAEYHAIARELDESREERLEFMQMAVQRIRSLLSNHHIRAEVSGRPKHIYSIWKKMQRKHLRFDQLFDVRALRIIVDTVEQCYEVLSIVQENFQTISKEYDDYIAKPKPNGYQSLHTVVTDAAGRPIEIQIRTRAMHEFAELGVAAHWRYKEGKQVADSLDNKLYWLRQILDWQNDTRDSEEFIKSLKVDLFSDEIFVFTPKGEIIDLPKGATPLDFAYRIHSAVGNKCVGAKVNGRIVTLDTPLNTGDFVEIITQQNSKGPSRDWLKIVKTAQAKAKIRQFYKKELKDENIANGKQMLDYEAKRQAVSLPSLLKTEYVDPILRKFSFADLDDLYAAVGCGGIAAQQVVTRLREEQRAHDKPLVPVLPRVAEPTTPARGGKSSSKEDMGIKIAGLPGCQVHFAKCCTPLPGDEIIGYITRGRGVTIHSKECVNVNASHDPARWVEAEWSDTVNSSYNGSIQILAQDRHNLLADLMSYLSAQKVTVCALNAKVNNNQTCSIELTLQVANKQELDWVIKQIAKRQDTIEIFRV